MSETASDDLETALTRSHVASQEMHDKYKEIGTRADEQLKRDLGTLFLDFGETLKYYIRLIFVAVFVGAFTHGAFVVLLALKLDGNSVFNWNVTLMPLAIFYGLWFIVSVIGFAALPLVTLTAEEYANDVKRNINIGWLLPEIDRRIALERERMTLEVRKGLAELLPLRDTCRWVNAYVETNLVGNDAVLKETLAAVERGDQLLSARLERQDVLLAKLLEVVGEMPEGAPQAGGDEDVDKGSNVDRTSFKVPVSAAQSASDIARAAYQDIDDAEPPRSVRLVVPAPSITVSSARKVPEIVVVKPDDQQNEPDDPDADHRSNQMSDQHSDQMSDQHSKEDTEGRRASLLQALSDLNDVMSARVSVVVSDDDADDDDELGDGMARGDDVAKHVLRAVRREIRRRERHKRRTWTAGAPDNGSTLSPAAVVSMIGAVLSESSAGEEEGDGVLPPLSQLTESLAGVDEAALNDVAAALKGYVSDKSHHHNKPHKHRKHHDRPAVLRRHSSSSRRRRSGTSDMGDFLKNVFMGRAHDVIAGAIDNVQEDGERKVRPTKTERAGDNVFKRTWRRSQKYATAGANAGAEVADAIGPPENLVEAFVVKGTDRDTEEFAQVRRKAVKSMASSALAEVAPDLLALTKDTNNALWGVRNTLHAIAGVLRGAHNTAKSIAEATHAIATAPTALAAFDRLGVIIRHGAHSHPDPDSLSVSLEVRAAQRRQLLKERMEEFERLEQRLLESGLGRAASDDETRSDVVAAPLSARGSAPADRAMPAMFKRAQTTPMPVERIKPRRSSLGMPHHRRLAMVKGIEDPLSEMQSVRSSSRSSDSSTSERAKRRTKLRRVRRDTDYT